MEKNRDPQNRHTNTVNWSLTKKQEQFSGEMIDFSTNGIVITGYPQAKKKKKKKNLDTGLTHFAKGLKMDHRPKCKLQNYKTSRR